jgi:hypothetical protein
MPGRLQEIAAEAEKYLLKNGNQPEPPRSNSLIPNDL